MTYERAVQYILEISKFSKKNQPKHVKLFLSRLGDPQEKMKVLHVAGTNGKGSVCVYLDAMLRAQGCTCGLFTSPHLVKLNERIVIQGEEIDDEAFCRVFEQVRKAAVQMQKEGLPHPTFFEFLFGMAATAFAAAGVEYAVLETGLGGRLDATNCVEHPVCCVITSIGFDHMQLLGNTLEEIAAEKAGIIKPGVPIFFIESGEKSDRVIEEQAFRFGSLCNKIRKNAFKIQGIEHKMIAFSCMNAYYGDTTWLLHNTGLYQPENAYLAMEVMRALFAGAGKPARWREALSGVFWQGRMEEVLPEVYIDGAHNVSAIQRFAESASYTGKECVILFSAVEDKEYEEMIACLCREVKAAYYMVTRIAGIRAADAGMLGELFRRYTTRPVFVRESLREAWEYVLSHREGKTVYCLGSLYLAGMVKAMIQEDA